LRSTLDEQRKRQARLPGDDTPEADINIVCEKMAYGGVTRFEDLQKAPLGISVNFTSFSAKMLAFLAFYPKLLVPYFGMGETADIKVHYSCLNGDKLWFRVWLSRL
jgi:hypothetical protein